ncbi:hypothetical protein RHGRI_003320 [Rhododendron griersonianum]|uniref:Major facilitator superfamily (MFS) profile domain-containing protein n=1 Tax=Rhododendron griersonianum TaxID=479676 RepID=A0AAV6L6B3_9ERIC|nr:hypothetical protein RHGRI_003320 [Rhododendron griersonianum]
MAIENGYQEHTVTEDLENPLLTEHEKVDESEKGAEKGSIGMVLLSTAVATCGSFEFGLCVGYSAPTQPAIREDLHLSLAEYSLFGSIVAIGAMVGAITSGKISDSIGRKWVPVFVAEIAPTNLRGGLTTLNQLMIVTGVSTAYLLGTLITWRLLALTGIVPCVVILFGLFFIPESPRWLAKTGKHKEFEAALRKLRGEDADVSREEAEIQARAKFVDWMGPNIGSIRSTDLPNTCDGYCWEFGDPSELVWYLGSFLYFQLSHELEFHRAELNLQVRNSLSDVYSKCKDFESARRVFSQMAERDLLSWNSLISGYGCNGFLQLALELLGTMRLEGFEPDFVTWKIAMDVYCRMGQCDEAWKIFEQIEEANIISWTTLISGYSRIGKA